MQKKKRKLNGKIIKIPNINMIISFDNRPYRNFCLTWYRFSIIGYSCTYTRFTAKYPSMEWALKFCYQKKKTEKQNGTERNGKNKNAYQKHLKVLKKNK